MRNLGIVLIVIGILMLIIPSINFTRKEKVVDIGPLEINKKENKTIAWPTYAGGIIAAVGVILIVSTKRK
jgi:hypothetical protein